MNSVWSGMTLDERVGAVCRLANRGMSSRMIADELGAPGHQWVYAVAKANNITLTRQRKPAVKVDLPKVDAIWSKDEDDRRRLFTLRAAAAARKTREQAAQ